MTQYFDTARYEMTHRRAPRGTGIWCFKCEGTSYRTPTMSYTEAKRWIVKELKDQKVSPYVTIVVLP